MLTLMPPSGWVAIANPVIGCTPPARSDELRGQCPVGLVGCGHGEVFTGVVAGEDRGDQW
ncbi:hypothetical protein [Nocardioides sp. B-3]|uniref:hypothetical protein n=1 Tax=Nocardioides sp. B-3 TaxID=2895565 RepID=UPI0021538922|nr:hypothetical protein [Nocardioides sp. B-3]UUZ57608.1 hypothetical protein LP418_14150 [Nocardioides sp. B-3]